MSGICTAIYCISLCEEGKIDYKHVFSSSARIYSTRWSRKIYPSKNSNKNNTRRRMKKCLYRTFQMYSQNIMNRLNFEMAAFCFDDESETGFHWSARPLHYVFIHLGLSWLNDCLQEVPLGMVSSWNIPLQNRPDDFFIWFVLTKFNGTSVF